MCEIVLLKKQLKLRSPSPGNYANKRRANEQHVESGKKQTPSIYYNLCTSYDWSAVLIEHVCKLLLK